MRKFNITVNGKAYEVEVEEVGGAPTPVASPAAVPTAPAPAPSVQAAAPKAAPAQTPAPAAAPAGGTNVQAPMPGTILSVKVNVGDTVSEGQVLCILEAMKMENEIMAPKAGKVVSVSVSQGSSVNSGDALVSIA
mgnify:CR=1 FL=1